MQEELIVTLNAGDPIPELASIAVPLAPFAQGFERPYSLNDWQDLRAATRQTDQRLYAMIPGFVMEEQIPELEELLDQVQDADGIYYGDEAVLLSAEEKGYSGLLIFQPDTLVCSSADVNAIQQMGTPVVCLAHELSLDEVLSIAEHCGGLEVQIHGWYPVLTSRRKLLNAYAQETGCPTTGPGRFDLQESTRSSLLPVLEDEAGTVLFSPEAVNSTDQIGFLQDAGIRRFRIDSRFLSVRERDEAIQVYRNLIYGRPGKELPGSQEIWGRKSVKTKGESL